MEKETELEKTSLAYKQIFKLLKKHEQDICFDLKDLEYKSRLDLLRLELKDLYGINIDLNVFYNPDWISISEYVKIGMYGEGTNRSISWPDGGLEPTETERLLLITFPTGPYIFGSGGSDKDYPVDFFKKFWMELVAFDPDFRDTGNRTLYWKMKNAKNIFNSFPEILKKYHELNKEDIKQRNIERLKAELKKLES